MKRVGGGGELSGVFNPIYANYSVVMPKCHRKRSQIEYSSLPFKWGNVNEMISVDLTGIDVFTWNYANSSRFQPFPAKAMRGCRPWDSRKWNCRPPGSYRPKLGSQ